MAKKTTRAPKAKNPQRTPPEVCACSVKQTFSKTTGKVSCPGRVVCSPSSKTLPKTYKIGEPGVVDPVSKPNERGQHSVVKLSIEPPSGSYSTKSDPCKTGRVGCPVQLVFKDSKPHVRFCGASKMVEKTDRKTGATRMVRVGAGEMGWIVPVPTPTFARRLVSAACKQWTKAGGAFTEKNIAVLKAKAARAGVGPDQALGRVRR